MQRTETLCSKIRFPHTLFRSPDTSLRANSPIWASEASRARTRERAAKPRGASERRSLSLPRPPQSRLLSRASRACTFHDIPQMESLLAGYPDTELRHSQNHATSRVRERARVQVHVYDVSDGQNQPYRNMGKTMQKMNSISDL